MTRIARARRAASAVPAMLLLGAFAAASDPQDSDAAAAAIRQRLGQLETAGGLAIGGEDLVLKIALPKLYAANGNRLLWTRELLQQLPGILRESAEDGLTPEDYHLGALSRLIPAASEVSADVETRANADLLATDGFVLLLEHLYRGKVNPRSLDPDWNFDPRPIAAQDAIRFVSNALQQARLAQTVLAVRPHHWWYGRARASLAEYRSIAARGGWSPIPPGPTLKLGTRDERVPALRRRLAVTGDLVGQPLDTPTFDAALAQAVRAFQTRHRLLADGSVGAGTLVELNVPVEARILQIRVNLERGRWVLHEVVPDKVVLVDIAGFDVTYMRDRETVWNARIQVGKPYRQTPVFQSAINQVVFNPTWSVPPTILAQDILPEVRRNVGYLATKKLEVLDRSGKAVDPATIDWARMTARNFPYTLRQTSGPDNALGRVKILFPNPHFVYLHDTPSKALFEREERAFSSGCIRVDRPLELAQLVLAGEKDWNAQAIARTIESGVTKAVRVSPPVPVLLLYWTIVPSDDGHTVFKHDPYGRDPRLAKALDAPFR